MAAYNYNRRFNFKRTYSQLALNAEGIGTDYSVNEQDKKKKETRDERVLRQSVQQAIAIYEASNGEINLFLDDNNAVDMDSLSGETSLSGKLAKYGFPGKRLSQSKYLGINQIARIKEEASMLDFFLQVSRKHTETDAICYDGEIKDVPRLEGYNRETFELRYVVATRGKRVPVNQIAQRRDELLLLLKEINKRLKGEFQFEILKWTIEVTFREIDGVIYAHPHLNLIYITEHLNEHQEQLWKTALHEATWDDENPNVGTGNYIRDCGAVENPEACLRYITKPYHPVDEDDKDTLIKDDVSDDKYADARHFGEYYGYQKTMEDEIEVGTELLLHELPPEELRTAYEALYTTAGSKPRTAGRGPSFRRFCNFFDDEGLNIQTKKNKFGYTEYVTVLKERKNAPETKEEKKKKRKKKKAVKKEENKASPVNYLIHSGRLIPDAEKGIMNVRMKVTGFDKEKNREYLRTLVDQYREQAILNKPDIVLPELHDDILTNEEREERKQRKLEAEKRDAVIKEREKLAEAFLVYTVWIIFYQIHLMSSYKQYNFFTLFSCSSSIKKHASLPKYDFIDEAKIFIQLHANAPPPRRSKTEQQYLSTSIINRSKTNAKQKYHEPEKPNSLNVCRNLET